MSNYTDLLDGSPAGSSSRNKYLNLTRNYFASERREDSGDSILSLIFLIMTAHNLFACWKYLAKGFLDINGVVSLKIALMEARFPLKGSLRVFKGNSISEL